MTTIDEAPIATGDLPKVPHAEAIALAAAQNEAFLAELKRLEPGDWDRVTDCDPWTVHDITVHLLAWANAVTSPREFFRQTKETLKVRKEWPNIVDAQNAVQVEEGRDLTPEVIISRLERALPRFLKVRDRLSIALKPIPTYNGLLGFISLGFIGETIFTRDTFMHRIDIAEATGKDMRQGPNEKRLVGDCVKEWGKASKANARVVLSGPAGGDYLVGDGKAATIRASATDFARVLAGRPRGESFSIEGDVQAAEKWLAVGCRF